MTDGLRRARCLLRLAPAVAVALIATSQAVAGPGTPPVMHPGQLVSTYYPHETIAVPTAAARDQAGRIVAVGQFSTRFVYANPSSTGIAVARFTASDRPDASFGTAGSTVSYATGAIPAGQSVTPQIVTPLPGGALLVGGFMAGHIFIERFSGDGALDRSFGSDGIVDRPEGSPAIPAGALALTPLADGTIVFVHAERQPQGASAKDVAPGGLIIDRLAPNGAQLSEVTYGPPEWIVGTSSSYPAWTAAHVFADGSVLAVGAREFPYTLPCPCTSQLEFLLRRFHPDGTVDTSFGTGGSTITRFGDSSATAQSLAVSNDGAIVVGGTTSGGSEDTNIVDVARYRPDGTPDASFGQGGTARVVGGDGDAVAVAADGSVFLSSYPQIDLRVFKLDRNGLPAAGFGTGGRASIDGGGRATALFPDAAGGVKVVIGSWNNANGGYAGDDFGLVRYTPAGALDTAFGRQSIPVGLPTPGGALAIASAAGEVATAGFAQDESGRVGMHVELIDGGLPQKSFGPNGGVTLFAGDAARATAVGIDSSGRVVAGGGATTGDATRWLVARFRADGTPDPAFGASGIVSSPETGSGDGVAGLAVLPDSRTLLLVRQGGRALLIRLAADGSLDISFGGAGRVAVPVPGAAALAVLPDGRAVVAGDGLACALVDVHGVVSGVSNPALASAVSVGIDAQRNGAFVVAGTTPAGVAVARRRSDGTLDPSFGSGGVATRDGVDAAGIAVQRDGRIDVAVRPRAAARFAVVRFLATGQVDSSFGDGGLAGAVDGGVANAITSGLLVAGTAPSPRGTDFGLVALYDDSLVYTVVGHLFHVTPKGVVRHVADGATQPMWSSAAGKLAYVTNDAGAADIAVGRGRTAHLITDSPLLDGAVVIGNPEWSRDGTLLAVRVRDAVGNPAVAVFSSAGGQPRRIVVASSALWAAGHDLAFVTVGDPRIEILDADTGRVRRVSTGWNVVPAPRGNLLAVGQRGWSIVRPGGTVATRLPARFYDPRWAPDGQHLSGFDRGRLAIVDLRGHERRLPVQAGEEARAPVWSLDGRLIAFVNKTGGVYFIDFVDTATGKPVGRWSPGPGFDYANPTWDATGIYIPTS